MIFDCPFDNLSRSHYQSLSLNCNKLVKYDRLGECSPEEDCLW